MKRDAIFSNCRKYRYTLTRNWGTDANPPYVLFIGLNPSTADENVDDPTIRRCIRYAKDWGYNAMCMVNIFAFRATDPNEMLAQIEPVGNGNIVLIESIAKNAAITVAAWGVHGAHRNRGNFVVRKLKEAGVTVHCLSVTDGGHPAHPLYLKASLRPVPYTITL